MAVAFEKLSLVGVTKGLLENYSVSVQNGSRSDVALLLCFKVH